MRASPWGLLRGLIWSDGCHFVNRTNGRYEYFSYDFRNKSSEILDIFVGACHQLGLVHRRYKEHIRIFDREAVGRMVEHVGTKA